eukprot:scaffold504_cov109-Cylindrotheca_fusiformis.AAC.11
MGGMHGGEDRFCSMGLESRTPAKSRDLKIRRQQAIQAVLNAQTFAKAQGKREFTHPNQNPELVTKASAAYSAPRRFRHPKTFERANTLHVYDWDMLSTLASKSLSLVPVRAECLGSQEHANTEDTAYKPLVTAPLPNKISGKSQPKLNPLIFLLEYARSKTV